VCAVLFLPGALFIVAAAVGWMIEYCCLYTVTLGEAVEQGVQYPTAVCVCVIVIADEEDGCCITVNHVGLEYALEKCYYWEMWH
jgi:hypothetical protein